MDNNFDSYLLKYARFCPYCDHAIQPIYLTHAFNKLGDKQGAILNCPLCDNLILVCYTTDGSIWYPKKVFPDNQNKVVFSDNIRKTSESFCRIYNQAEKAANLGLNELCGVGYRKALEFLIKDYVILKHPEDIRKIKIKPLKKCIDDYINYQEIKECATRAVFIGNDETHYIKKWENKDINDLKILIDLTVKWIDLNLTTENICNSMPIESKK